MRTSQIRITLILAGALSLLVHLPVASADWCSGNHIRKTLHRHGSRPYWRLQRPVWRSCATTFWSNRYSRLPVRACDAYPSSYHRHHARFDHHPPVNVSLAAIDALASSSALTRQPHLIVIEAEPTGGRPTPMPASATRSTPTADMVTPGWVLLSRGHSRLAMERFNEHIADVPSDGLPHLGRAIAAAEQHSYGKAVTAMRTALQIDPSCLSRFQCDETTRELVVRLAHVLESLATLEPPRVIAVSDARFGSAMCHVLLKNQSEALNRLREDGNGKHLDAESRLLKDLLEAGVSNADPAPASTHAGPSEDVKEGAKIVHSP